MRRLRALLVLAFGVLSSVALFVTSSEAKPETIRLMAPGVWFREGDIQDQGHCNNIMNGTYKVVGIGYAFNTTSTYDHYWTADFAKP